MWCCLSYTAPVLPGSLLCRKQASQYKLTGAISAHSLQKRSEQLTTSLKVLFKLREWTNVGMQAATYREQKKMADKQRKLQEKAHRIKEESLRDDDNVFDVAFENQGIDAAEGAVSATDIKVNRLKTSN